MATSCGTMFPHDSVKDKSGCTKPDNHKGMHECIAESGAVVEWQEDYSCKCGCWETYEDFGDACILYNEKVTTNTKQ